jgi:hypothetical protein
MMRTFRDADQPNKAPALYNLVSSAEEHKAGVYLGMFEDPSHECGLSLALHGIKQYALTLGRPNLWTVGLLHLFNTSWPPRFKLVELGEMAHLQTTTQTRDNVAHGG